MRRYTVKLLFTKTKHKTAEQIEACLKHEIAKWWNDKIRANYFHNYIFILYLHISTTKLLPHIHFITSNIIPSLCKLLCINFVTKWVQFWKSISCDCWSSKNSFIVAGWWKMPDKQIVFFQCQLCPPFWWKISYVWQTAPHLLNVPKSPWH